MRGRKPKPTSRQIAEGDPRKKGKRKLAEKQASEPEAKRGLPACPSHLTGRAVQAWKFWVAELEQMNLDSRPDAMMLEGACVNYQRAVQADLVIQEQGITVEEPVTNKLGELVGVKVKKHPACEVSARAWSLVKAFCSEFGLSPVSRTRLTIDKSEKADDLMEMLSRPRHPRSAVTVQ